MTMHNEPPGREALVIQIQSGDKQLREQFLRDYQGFVAATISSVMGGRSIDRAKDAVFNTGLLALNEALDSYNPGKGVSFIYFARQVITRRVIDTLRRDERESRLNVSTPIDNVSHSAMTINPAIEKIEVQEELKSFAGQLNKFGFTMSDLVKHSPRHKDSKKLAIKIGRTLAEDPELIAHLLERQTIPLKKLLKKINVNPKTVERHRTYIIAIAIILAGNLDTLKDYIYAVDEGGH